MRLLVPALLAVLSLAPAAAQPAVPQIAEPLVFDMVRGLGARQGELETNVLATTPLSGQERVLEWAPEIEYAVADNLAIEFELPFENRYLAELKVGVQGTFGTLDGGRIVHGFQYLGLYDRHDGSVSNALLYLIGRRHSPRWSTMTMVGVGDVRLGQSEEFAGLLVNHSTFYDLSNRTVLGLEINWKTGPDGGLLLMPQIHRALTDHWKVQAGAGVDNQRGARARPVGGLRVIREF
ncbi:MAG: hypothetical protein PGN09_05310 [Sphingomonas fennica]